MAMGSGSVQDWNTPDVRRPSAQQQATQEPETEPEQDSHLHSVPEE